MEQQPIPEKQITDPHALQFLEEVKQDESPIIAAEFERLLKACDDPARANLRKMLNDARSCDPSYAKRQERILRSVDVHTIA